MVYYLFLHIFSSLTSAITSIYLSCVSQEDVSMVDNKINYSQFLEPVTSLSP